MLNNLAKSLAKLAVALEPMDTPTLWDGSEVKSAREFAEVAGIPLVEAKLRFKSTEQPEDLDEKGIIKRVRDSGFWHLPVGTLIRDRSPKGIKFVPDQDELDAPSKDVPREPTERWGHIGSERYPLLSPHETGIEASVKQASPTDADMNCSRCVWAYELRRRGYDVQARPTIASSTYTHTGAVKDQLDGFVFPDRATKKQRIADLAREMSLLDVEDEVENTWPPGARGFVLCHTVQGTWHVMSVENVNGLCVILDAQRAHGVVTPQERRQLFETWGVVRVDDLDVDGSVHQYVTRG